MARRRRMFRNNAAYFITARTSEGLPFVCCLLIHMLMFGIIARAKSLYPNVKICAWLFMGNHFHAILVNRGDSTAIPNFMEFVDGEIAKTINRLRGRRNFSVWGDRYHAEPLITPGAVMKKTVYLYMNPVRADLVDSIAEYPGASTWREFIGHKTKSYLYYGSGVLRKLPKGKLSLSLCKQLLTSFRKNIKIPTKQDLTIESFAWFECFTECASWDENTVRQEILTLIAQEESAITRTRKKNSQRTIGRRALIEQCFFKKFQTTNFLPRALCISTCDIARQNFNEVYREFCKECSLCWESSLKGLIDVQYPTGAFRPGRQPPASLLCQA